MKGMIFAAGLGTRLRPLTDECPKCLIDVGGKPMLRRVIENMRSAGVGSIVVNVHHHAQKVTDYLANNDFGVEVSVSDESDLLLDTGGGIVKAAHMLWGDEPIVIHNADVWTDLPLRDMIENHVKTGADVTLLTRDSVSARALMWRSDRRMGGWANLNSSETRPHGLDVQNLRAAGFGGVHVMNPGVMDTLVRYATEKVFSITPFYADMCGMLDIRAYPVEPFRWIDIGKPESLALARAQTE